MIIGLTAPAMTGKTTTAAALHGLLPYSTVLSIADPLYAMLATLMSGVGRAPDGECWADYLRDQRCKNTPLPVVGVTPRRCLQTLGAEWARQCVSEDLWCDIARRRLEGLQREGYQSMIIDDVRFANEAAMVRSMGGHVVRLHRPLAAAGAPQHGSEQMDFPACATVAMVPDDPAATAAAVLAVLL
jgi:hypothetical protein